MTYLPKLRPITEGMQVNYGDGEIPSKPTDPTTWIEFSLPERLEDECWEMIEKWLKDKGVEQ
jgi:hypothetical protein